MDLYIQDIEFAHEEDSKGELRVSSSVNGCTEHVYEIKADSAVRQATGANEIIRQFKRHCNYFYRDNSRNPHPDTWSITFELCFVASPVTWAHVVENLGMYNELAQTVPYTGERKIRTVDLNITFRMPDDYAQPVLVTADAFPDEYQKWPTFKSIFERMGV